EHAERAAVVVELRREAQTLAIGEGRVVRCHALRSVDPVAEDALLTGRAIRRERRIGRRAADILPRGAETEAEAAQAEVARIDERLEEQAGRVVARGIRLDIRCRQVLAALAV